MTFRGISVDGRRIITEDQKVLYMLFRVFLFDLGALLGLMWVIMNFRVHIYFKMAHWSNKQNFDRLPPILLGHHRCIQPDIGLLFVAVTCTSQRECWLNWLLTDPPFILVIFGLSQRVSDPWLSTSITETITYPSGHFMCLFKSRVSLPVEQLIL